MATFGNTGTGTGAGSPQTRGDDVATASKFTIGENGTATSMSLYAQLDTGAPNQLLKFACYDDSSGPNNLLFVTDTVLCDSETAAWWNANLAGGEDGSLTAGDYWLAFLHGDNDTTIKYHYDDLASGEQYDLATTWPNYNDPFDSNGTLARSVCIYCTYTPSGAGVSIPVAMHHYGHHISKIIRG